MEPQLCSTCGHHHESGVRCGICGHVGRSQIFFKMKIKAEQKRKRKVIVYTDAHFQSHASFCNELICKFDPESTDVFAEFQRELGWHRKPKNPSALLGIVACTVGDNIGGLLSLRYFEDGNFNVVLLDDALVSFTYRRSNIFYQLIDGALKFLLSMLSSSEALIFQKLRITISPDAKSGWQDNKLQSEGFQLNSLFDGTREYDMDVNYHTLLQIAQYIRSKI